MFSRVLQLYPGGKCTYPCFPGVLWTSTPHNILSKPLAAVLHNHCWNNGQQWERNESCRNDYHQSSERILAEPAIKPARSCSQVPCTTDWALEHGKTIYSQTEESKNCCRNTHYGEQLCQNILKSIQNCRSYGQDKNFTFKCDLDLGPTWTNISNGTSTSDRE